MLADLGQALTAGICRRYAKGESEPGWLEEPVCNLLRGKSRRWWIGHQGVRPNPEVRQGLIALEIVVEQVMAPIRRHNTAHTTHDRTSRAATYGTSERRLAHTSPVVLVVQGPLGTPRLDVVLPRLGQTLGRDAERRALEHPRGDTARFEGLEVQSGRHLAQPEHRNVASEL